jgi:hypothetical protein
MCPASTLQSSAPVSQSFLGLSSGGSGQSWSTATIAASGVFNSLTPSATENQPVGSATVPGTPSNTVPGGSSDVQPNCPAEPAGRVYADNLGTLYGIYCNTVYQDQTISAQEQSSFSDCVNACDTHNLFYFHRGTPCRGVSYQRNSTGATCFLKRSVNYPVTSSDFDSAPLLNPQQPPGNPNYSSLFPSLIATVSTLTMAPTATPPANGPVCPDANNSIYQSPNQDVWWILCGQTALVPRAPPNGLAPSRDFTRLAFSGCIDLCSVTHSCSYVEFNPRTNVCHRYIYACQFPLPGEWSAVLVADASGLVRQPSCGNLPGGGTNPITLPGGGVVTVTQPGSTGEPVGGTGFSTMTGSSRVITDTDSGTSGGGVMTVTGSGGLPTTAYQTQTVTQTQIKTSVSISAVVVTFVTTVSGSATTIFSTVVSTAPTTVVETVTSIVTQTLQPVTITGPSTGSTAVTVGSTSTQSTFICHSTAVRYLPMKKKRALRSSMRSEPLEDLGLLKVI